MEAMGTVASKPINSKPQPVEVFREFSNADLHKKYPVEIMRPQHSLARGIPVPAASL